MSGIEIAFLPDALERAKRRLAGLTAISATLDLGSGLTVVSYGAKVVQTEAALSLYNQLLSQIDAALNDVEKQEKELNDLTERMLDGVGARYGHDSNEYEKAGGTRKSERRRPVREEDQDTPAAA